MVFSYIYMKHYSINLCGVEDSVENYRTYLISCCTVMVFESCGIVFFFSICHSYLDLSHDCHAQLCFHTHAIFTAHTSLGCRNVAGFSIASQKTAATDPI